MPTAQPDPAALVVRLSVPRPGWHTLRICHGATVLRAASWPDSATVVPQTEPVPSAVLLPCDALAALLRDVAAAS